MKSYLFRNLWFISILLCVNPSALPVCAAPDRIVPGHSIGQVRLGELLDKVEQLNGRIPDESDAASGKAINAWFDKGKRHSELEIWTSRYADYPDGRENVQNRDLVEQIRVTSSFFETQEGLSIGSDQKQLHNAFPQAKLVRYFISPANKRVDLYDDKASGIAFEVTRRNRKVVHGICSAILVHPKGASVLSTSLWFYPSENGDHFDERYLKSMSPAASPQHCLVDQVPAATSIIFTPFQGGSQDPHPHTTVTGRLTGIEQPYRARTRNQMLISRLLKTLYYTGSLNNGQHWNPAFYDSHLEEIPKIDIELDTANQGAIKLQLFIVKYQGKYLLSKSSALNKDGSRDAGGIAVVDAASLHRFLSLFRSFASQARQTNSRLEVYYPQGD